ncbi:MAG: glycoside hydrolase family 2 TIM barrel-domain containing protein [Salinibacterium amurskyense]
MLPVIADLHAWADPAIVALGRLPLGSLRAVDSNRELSLDGRWAFSLYSRPEDVPASAVGAAVDPSRSPLQREPALCETHVTVPGNWTMQSVGDLPHYTNVQMPFDGPPPALPPRNPAGVYRRSIQRPPAWAGQRVVLSIGGADSVHAVYIDGEFVGYGTDARLASGYDVTAPLSDGAEHDLAIVVIRYSAHSYVEDQDAWWMAGLHRSVTLEAHPAVSLADAVIIADWDHAIEQASLSVTASVTFSEAVCEGYTVAVSVTDLSGASILSGLTAAVDHEAARTYQFKGFRGVVKADSLAVQPWSAESPTLYRCSISLIDPDGVECDRTEQRVGFRRVEIVGPDLLVNGRRIWIHGVNRHDHHPDKGTALSRDDLKADLVAMRRLNITAIRTSHYPNAPEFLDLCDELGFYVIDEANIESHAYNWYLCDDPSYRAAWAERVARMVQRDRNHPSIIMWSLGNESGYGANHDACAGWLRHEDPTRPLHYEDAIRIEGWIDGGLAATDVVCPMYPTFADVREYGEQVAAGIGTRPFIMCEYSHAMGNANGSLADYWDLMWTYPGLQGGFIWEWKDHGLRVTPEGESERLAFGGMFGDAPHDRNFVMDGVVSADLIPHPAASEVLWVYRPVATSLTDSTITIQSQRSFESLDDLSCRWQLLVNGAVHATGLLDVPTVEPGAGISVPAPVAIPEIGEVIFSVEWSLAQTTWFAPAGHIVAVDQSVVREAPISVAESGAPVAETFGLTQWSGPELQLWRPPIDNDGFKLISNPEREERIGGTALRRWLAQGLFSENPETLVAHTVERTASATGDIYRHEMVVGEELDDLPRVGVRYFADPRFDRIRWYGRGPGDNYADRKCGSMIGVWESALDDCPHVVPQEFGLRSDTRWFELVDSLTGDRIRFESLGEPFHFSALQYSAEAIYEEPHVADLRVGDRVVISIDAAHRGVGNHACGEHTLPQYQVRSGTHRLDYRVSAQLASLPRLTR